MARCPKCGKENPEEARFCRSCGGRLAAPAAEAAAPDPELAPEQRSQRLLEEAFRLSEQGRILAAIQTCLQAISLNPQSTSAHSLLGTLYERQGDRERAIREYEQVLTLSPESTVERRRLNELMGVPAAREAVTVSPRTARLAITGAFGALVVIAVIAFVIGRPSAPRPEGGLSKTGRATAGGQAITFNQPGPMLPAPGQSYVSARSAPVPLPSLPAAAASQPWSGNLAPAAGGATVLGQGAYYYPSTGGERYYSGQRGVAAPPVAGAQPYRGTPVVEGAGYAPMVGGATAQTGRDYYLQGDYQRAANSYQQYLAQHPSAGGAPREELAWVYMQMGDRTQAEQQYQAALNGYTADVERGHNTEAARHGLRTCQSAIRALEAR